MSTKVKLGLVAGNGILPIKLAENALAAGVELVVATVTKEAYRNFKKAGLTEKITVLPYSIFDFFKIIDSAKEQQVKEITFIGKVPKLDFLLNLHKFDMRILDLLKGRKDFNDDTIHDTIANLLENLHQLHIIEQTRYLQDLFPKKQVFSKRLPSADEIIDIEFGMRVAKGIAGMDIGQTVIIQNKSVIAVEAIEGTDRCIKRAKWILGGPFARNKQITVCKVSKPEQDQRFDIPAVGLTTIKNAGPGSIVAFEAEKTLFIEEEGLHDYVNKHNICLLAV